MRSATSRVAGRWGRCRCASRAEQCLLFVPVVVHGTGEVVLCGDICQVLPLCGRPPPLRTAAGAVTAVTRVVFV